jgi:hypothetical protein
MKTLTKDDELSSAFINEFALKNYRIYVKHYESRELQPVSFQEFLKNYIS